MQINPMSITGLKSTEVTISGQTVSGNSKKNLGSLTSNLPSGSTFVSWVIKSGFDSDLMPYVLGGTLFVKSLNSSALTISVGKVDVFYI